MDIGSEGVEIKMNLCYLMDIGSEGVGIKMNLCYLMDLGSGGDVLRPLYHLY